VKKKVKRIELEDAHSELERKIKEVETVLEQKEIGLKHARENLAEHQRDLGHHETNMKFMRTKADVVDLREFSGVAKLLERSQEEAEDATIKTSKLVGDVAHINKIINKSRGELSKIRATLDACGQVLQGPWKKP
jgi:hypothetical protein